MKLFFYDLETNGVSHSLDRILEVYFLKVVLLEKKRLKRLSEFHSYVKIENNHVDMYAFHKNGWTEEFLNTKGRPMDQVVKDVYEILSEDNDTILCGYFIRTFDNLFLKKMERRYGLPAFNFEENTFDIALEYKAQLAGLYERFPKEKWRMVHEMVLNNDYSHYIKKTSYGLKTEECCRYYGIPVDSSKQHNAKYDTVLAMEILKKQKPEWFGIEKI